MNCKKKIKSIDMFGKQINFNLSKEGETFNTSYGIFSSILIYLIVGMYAIQRSYVLSQKSNNNVSSVNQPIDINSFFGKVYLNQTKMLFFITL